MVKHPLISYASAVDRTHKGLGAAAAFCLLSTKARKCCMVVGASGTGKTTAVHAALQGSPFEDIVLDAVTRSGLKSYEETLNEFEGSLVVNDLGSIDTVYSVGESLKVLALLAYEHGLTKNNSLMNLAIKDFKGATTTTCQPVMMNKLIRNGAWESVLADKVIRYYHLVRPVKTAVGPIEEKAPWGYDREVITGDRLAAKSARNWADTHITQWSYARTIEHLTDLYEAAAALAERKSVTKADIEAVGELCKPLWLEKYLIRKNDFESQHWYDHRSHCVMTELATYGRLEKLRTCRNYKISERTYSRIMSNTNTWCLPNPKQEGGYAPSQQFLDLLKECRPITGGRRK